VSKPIGIYY